MTTTNQATTVATTSSLGLREFDAHPGRGRFNAAFFWVMGGYIDWHLRHHKAKEFAGLPSTVVELGEATYRVV